MLQINEKLCISIKEAAEYSGIGEKRLRKIIDDNPLVDWALHIDSHIRVKRPLFEKWVMEQQYL